MLDRVNKQNILFLSIRSRFINHFQSSCKKRQYQSNYKDIKYSSHIHQIQRVPLRIVFLGGVAAFRPIIPPLCFQILEKPLFPQLKYRQIQLFSQLRIYRSCDPVPFRVKVATYFDGIARTSFIQVFIDTWLDQEGILSFGFSFEKLSCF